MSSKAAKQETLTNLQSYKTKGLTFLKTSNESEITRMIVLSNDEYYNSSSPSLTDTEFDILKEYASEKYPNNSEINCIGAPITKNKVTLPYDMPSMDKIKPDTNALSQWISTQCAISSSLLRRRTPRRVPPRGEPSSRT